MARKPRGHDFDDAVGLEQEPDAAEPSRSQRKRESRELTRLGEELVALPADRCAKLDLPERLADALIEAKRLTSFGARRRQALFIGKLMRALDDEALARIRRVLRNQ